METPLLILFYPLSLLPLSLLYGLSALTRGILFGMMGYRRDVLRDNLLHAFPEKTEKEREDIRRRFERSFCDQWVETLKLLSMSRKELNRRVTGNWEVFEQLNQEGRNVYVLLGHQFNWEWASVACQWNSPQLFSGVYLPLENKGFDELMKRIRTRGGGVLISLKAFRDGLRQLEGKRYILGLIADQNPSQPDTAHWLPFMNRDTPFFRGTESSARKAEAAVVFASFRKKRRGYYDVLFERKWNDANEAPAGAITEAYVSFLQEALRAQPENWLWSHRRWKHKRNQEA